MLETLPTKPRNPRTVTPSPRLLRLWTLPAQPVTSTTGRTCFPRTEGRNELLSEGFPQGGRIRRRAHHRDSRNDGGADDLVAGRTATCALHSRESIVPRQWQSVCRRIR